MRGEADATAEKWAALQQKLSQINDAPQQKPGKGALAQLDAAEESAAAQSGDKASQRAVDEAKRIREQIGDQRVSNQRAGMSDEELLANLQREERRLFKSDPSGAREGELKRLQVVGQIEQLERQIAERRKQQEEASRPKVEFGPGTAEAAMGGFRVDAANFAAQQREEALRIAQEQSGQMTGSFGASALQRIGFASNEFFDTRRKEDPTKETKRVADAAKEILNILKKGEPLVLPSSN
jgi:hypothetical protein